MCFSGRLEKESTLAASAVLWRQGNYCVGSLLAESFNFNLQAKSTCLNIITMTSLCLVKWLCVCVCMVGELEIITSLAPLKISCLYYFNNLTELLVFSITPESIFHTGCPILGKSFPLSDPQFP